MKKVLFLLSVSAIFSASGQKTIQFSDPLPPNSPAVPAVDASLFGAYKNTSSGTTYVFDPEGISIVSTIVAYVTREQLRESSTIAVRNGYLFGVVKGDSVPCTPEGERYYYGMRHKEVVVGPGSLNLLTRIDAKTYVVNFHEGSYFEPSLFTFGQGQLNVVHGDLTWQDSFDRILKARSIERYGSPVDVLTPSFEQWPQLRSELFGGETLNYPKDAE